MNACIQGRARPTRAQLRQRLAFEENPLPEFQIYQQPEPVTMLSRTRVMLLGQASQRVRFKQSSIERPWPQHELLDNGPERPSEPFADRHGETHLASREDLPRDQVPECRSQHGLRLPAPE